MARHETQQQNVQKIWKNVVTYYDGNQIGINVNNAPPGCGKTYGFIEHIKKNHDKRYAYFSSNHEQLDRVEKELGENNLSSVHWKGFPRICPRYPNPDNRDKRTPDEKLIYDVYHIFSSAPKFICSTCEKQKGCSYQAQFNKREKIVLAPLEFLFREDIEERFDEIWIDETIKKIVYYLWDFSPERFVKFMETLKEIKKNHIPSMEKYLKIFGKLHKEFMQQVSIIFTRHPEELLHFDDNSYSGKEWSESGFLQNNEFVTHLAEIDLTKILKESKFKNTEKYYMFQPYPRMRINNEIDFCIREAIRIKKIENIISNYISLGNYFNFLDVLTFCDLCKAGCIVSERIEIVDNPAIIILKTIIKDDNEYEWGFIEEKPYLLEKKTNRYVISNIGKEFIEEKRSFESISNSWLTVGQSFMMRAFKLAEKKPVILMDASFNKKIYEQHLFRFINEEAVMDSPYSIEERYLDEQKIQNKSSIVYKINPDKRRDSKYSKESLEKGGFELICSSLKTIMPELKRVGKIGAIMPLDFEVKFKLCDTNHFFNQRGTNKFKDYNILIVIGTPYVPPFQILFRHVLNFGKIPKDFTVVRDKQGHFQGYKDELLQELLQYFVYDELYQAIHRCRPLLGNKKIICFCKLPEKIEAELTIKKLTFNEFCAELQGKKEYYQEYPLVLIKLISSPNDKITQNIINKICSSDPKTNHYTPLVLRLHKLLELPPEFDLESTEEILNDALSPIKIKIVNLLKRPRYKRMGLTKLHKQTKSPRAVVNLCLWLLEKEDLVEIKVDGNKKKVILKKEL